MPKSKKISEGDQVFFHVVFEQKAASGGKLFDIGLFSTASQAKAIVSQLRSKPGFAKASGMFHVSKRVIGHVGWAEGYLSVVNLHPTKELNK
jgi:hypothetical protein